MNMIANEEVHSFVYGAGSFSKYGKVFQERVLQGLLYDHVYAAQMHEVMKADFFDVKYLEYLCSIYFSYFDKYKHFPGLSTLLTIVKDDLVNGNDIILRDQIINYLHQIKTNPNINDVDFVKDKSLDFCKRQAMRHALEEAVNLIDDEKFDSVVGLMKNAAAIGIPHTTGHDFFEELEARFVQTSRNVVPTGLKALDSKNVLNGGLGKGELGVVTANTGVGKCTTYDTCIKVRYMEIVIDGLAYRPWDKVQTKRGNIFVRDINETDEII